MEAKALFDHFTLRTSKQITRAYSTSFSLGIQFLSSEIRNPIYSIYGFVRLADEIVDSFHSYDKKQLLDEFRKDTWLAIERKISLNPILNSFQWVVNKYCIPHDLIQTFLDSMEMDLDKKNYNPVSYKQYILGSAEVVGLMCLKVFVKGDDKLYKALKDEAMALGSAFQKINFLRDVKADYEGMGRTYFPGVNIESLDEGTKREIEVDILLDFHKGLSGIKKLPRSSRLGVYVAYIYYYALFKKIQGVPPDRILKERIRISNHRKMALFAGSWVRHNLNLL
jgi:phytoene/squalene synthetase